MDAAVQLLWRRIETWMRQEAPNAWQKLAPGATEQELQQTQDALGIALPAAFKASSRIHNGGYRMHLVTEMEMLPLEKIVERWQMLKELLDLDTWSGLTPYYFTESVIRSGWQTGSIQATWWNTDWIPFGGDLAGNYCCLDLAPATGGTVGQIIDWDHDTGPSRVLFPSFQRLLSTFADQLECGHYLDTSSGLTIRPEFERGE